MIMQLTAKDQSFNLAESIDKLPNENKNGWISLTKTRYYRRNIDPVKAAMEISQNDLNIT